MVNGLGIPEPGSNLDQSLDGIPLKSLKRPTVSRCAGRVPNSDARLSPIIPDPRGEVFTKRNHESKGPETVTPPLAVFEILQPLITVPLRHVRRMMAYRDPRTGMNRFKSSVIVEQESPFNVIIQEHYGPLVCVPPEMAHRIRPTTSVCQFSDNGKRKKSIGHADVGTGRPDRRSQCPS